MSSAGPEQTTPLGVSASLNEAPLGLFHLRAVLTAGMGFFTDAYDLFVIGPALVLIKVQWHLSAGQISLLGSISLIAAFLGAFVFGRLADLLGRKRIYGLEAAIMAAAAVASAFAPTFGWLLVFRLVLGFAIGGDYPISAVLMSEYANRKDRGKLVGLVFSMQALGLLVGPIVALTLLASGVGHGLAWRLLLGLGAVPAAAVIYFRRRLPESPRYLSRVEGRGEQAVADLAALTDGTVRASADRPARRLPARTILTNRRYLMTMIGTAGTWFLFDYAYYGNTISTPLILKTVAPHATLIATQAWTLVIFAIAAVPGYLLAVATMDRIGHRRLQIIGFVAMAAAFLSLALIPQLTSVVVPFLLVYGLSYFFSEFGPNTTTFVLSAELFPVSLRTTGHGVSAGVAKIGAFIGVFVFPLLSATLGLRGTLGVTAGFSMLGALLTRILPEPAGRTLEELSAEDGEDVVPLPVLAHTATPAA